MAFNPNARLDPTQVEDRRGRRMGPMVAGGGGLTLIVAIVAMLLGVNPADIGIDPTAPQQNPYQQTAPGQPPEVAGAQTTASCQTGEDANRRADCRMVGFVDSIQAYWTQEFERRGSQYVPARTVLFSGATQAECGFAQAAQGPFYCPLDQKIYLDLTFFQELNQRFGARGGPFAEGYVVAHEYGHHIQNVLGILERADTRDTGPQGDAVRVELMADCLAGVWAQHAATTGYLQKPSERDIASALDAAAAVGDDRIQRTMQGRVSPEAWTHGSSEQRMRWFQTGYQSGDMMRCDTRQGRV